MLLCPSFCICIPVFLVFSTFSASQFPNVSSFPTFPPLQNIQCRYQFVAIIGIAIGGESTCFKPYFSLVSRHITVLFQTIYFCLVSRHISISFQTIFLSCFKAYHCLVSRNIHLVSSNISVLFRDI